MQKQALFPCLSIFSIDSLEFELSSRVLSHLSQSWPSSALLPEQRIPKSRNFPSSQDLWRSIFKLKKTFPLSGESVRPSFRYQKHFCCGSMSASFALIWSAGNQKLFLEIYVVSTASSRLIPATLKAENKHCFMRFWYVLSVDFLVLCISWLLSHSGLPFFTIAAWSAYLKNSQLSGFVALDLHSEAQKHFLYLGRFMHRFRLGRTLCEGASFPPFWSEVVPLFL